jgi:hypothetical protein
LAKTASETTISLGDQSATFTQPLFMPAETAGPKDIKLIGAL